MPRKKTENFTQISLVYILAFPVVSCARLHLLLFSLLSSKKEYMQVDNYDEL